MCASDKKKEREKVNIGKDRGENWVFPTFLGRITLLHDLGNGTRKGGGKAFAEGKN